MVQIGIGQLKTGWKSAFPDRPNFPEGGLKPPPHHAYTSETPFAQALRVDIDFGCDGSIREGNSANAVRKWTIETVSEPFTGTPKDTNVMPENL